MSNATRLMHDSDGYFEELPKGTQEIVKDLILEAANDRNGPEGFKSDQECLDEIECHSRSGFIPFSHNKGGILYQNFATHMDYFGSGYSIAHKEANKRLESLIEESFSDISEDNGKAVFTSTLIFLRASSINFL